MWRAEMKTPSLIALAAHAPGSGKTAIARIFEGEGFVRLPFAEPVKQMAAALLEGLGIEPEQVHNYLYVDRAALIPVLDVSGRHLLQTLGTEWGRRQIHPEIWVRHWQRRLQLCQAAGHRVVVDDIRFPNEADAIRQLGGQVWLVERPGIDYRGNHASEGGLQTYAGFSRLLVNDDTLLALRDKVLGILACEELAP